MIHDRGQENPLPALGARLGPGPRDGLMTGLHARSGRPIWLVRTLIEVTVLTIGWLLGGNVGIGTLIFALAIGPLAGLTIPWLRVPELASPAPSASDRADEAPVPELGEEVAR